MMTIHTTVMSIHAATKLIPLLAIVDDEEQRTDNINNNPLPTKFQRNLLQSTIFARLPFSHTLQQHIHNLVKVARGATFVVCIVGMTVHRS